MTIAVKMIEHSASTGCPDMVTMQARYPRMIHAEAKTHRVLRIDDAEVEFLQEISLMDDPNLSRNASSSRAVPIERMIQEVLDDPAMPEEWGSNKPGMQAGDELRHWQVVRDCWLDARDFAVERAKEMMNLGAHKQIVNRILEPFAHISVVVSGTDWQNFFDLRCHPHADPTMRVLAEQMRDCIKESKPRRLTEHEWHMPYITEGERTNFASDVLRRASAARCARVSYLNHDGTDCLIGKDLELADRLFKDRHLSPFEHQARPNFEGGRNWGNLTCWDQGRKLMELSL